jgi:hypothetical protein
MKRISKLTFLALSAFAVLVLGLTSCSKSDNPTPVDITLTDQDIVGMWWDEFEYADVTEEGKPFSRVLLVVEADADHTGCIYLGVFDEKSDEPLAIYGGPDEAGFTWKLLADGRILLGDPVTGESYALTRGNGDSFCDNMTDASNTRLTYNNGSMTATNEDYSGTLDKADAEKEADIQQKLRLNIGSNVGLGLGGNTPEDFDESDIR